MMLWCYFSYTRQVWDAIYEFTIQDFEETIWNDRRWIDITGIPFS